MGSNCGYGFRYGFGYDWKKTTYEYVSLPFRVWFWICFLMVLDMFFDGFYTFFKWFMVKGWKMLARLLGKGNTAKFGSN